MISGHNGKAIPAAASVENSGDAEAVPSYLQGMPQRQALIRNRGL